MLLMYYPPRVVTASYNGANTGRITKGAAQTLLAKVYLQKGANPIVAESGDFQEAVTLCDEVINSGEYMLADDYRSIFDIDSENGGGNL